MPNRDVQDPSPPYFEIAYYDLASTRDLRALMLETAEQVQSGGHPALVTLYSPRITRPTIAATWEQVAQLLRPDIASRMYYSVSSVTRVAVGLHPPTHVLSDLRIERPNYTFEVLRIIANANLSRADSLSITRITELIGCSESPVRRALKILEQADVIRGYACDVPSLTLDLLGRVGALPQTVRFRFKQGATPRAPHEMRARAMKAMGSGDALWDEMSLSGVAAAAMEFPDLDLMGLPRLDLCLRTQRHSVVLDLCALEALSTGLEVETNPTAPAPVVVSLPRSTTDLARDREGRGTPLASRFDVYLSLLDMELRPQAVAYAECFFMKRSKRTS